jgi:hypothetical protein
MKIEEKTVIKYFDIVLLADKKDSFFGIYKILIPKYFKADTSEEKTIVNNLWSEIKEFSEFHGYFEFFPNGHCKLTEKGLLAKEKGGHLKYKKSLTEKPLDWYKIIGLILTVVFGLSTIYFSKKSFDLKENQSDVIIENDSLKVQVASYKDSIVELKEQIELYRLKTLNDTLQTKNLIDLKTD